MENTTQTIATIGEQTDVLEKIVGMKTIIPSILISITLMVYLSNGIEIFYGFVVGGIFLGISLVKQKTTLVVLSLFHILLPFIMPTIMWFAWFPLVLMFGP